MFAYCAWLCYVGWRKKIFSRLYVTYSDIVRRGKESITSSTCFLIQWLLIYFIRSAYKYPAVRHCYWIEKGFSGITLSYLTFWWRFVVGILLWTNFQVILQSETIRASTENKTGLQNSPKSRTANLLWLKFRVILQTLYNTLTPNTPVPS
jgi:hypothetical protein